MAFDASGNWKPEDDSTSGKLNGLLQTDSPLMDQAKTAGTTAASARGLTNSSLAVGAAQDSLYRTAVPIAAADAQAVQAKNLAGMSQKSQADLQTADLAAQAGRQQTQIDANTATQTADTKAQADRLATQNAANATLQGNDIKAQNDRLAQQLGSSAALQAAQLAAQKEQQGIQLDSTERQQVNDLNAAMARLNLQTSANVSMQQAQLTSQEKVSSNGLLSNEKIAAMTVSSNDRERAAAAAASAQSVYASMYNAILDNKDIPAATRNEYLTHISAVQDSNLALVEQIYGVDLKWSSAANGATGTTGLGPGLAAPAPALASSAPAATAGAPATATTASAVPATNGLLGPGGVAANPQVSAAIAARLSAAMGGGATGNQDDTRQR